MFTEVSFWLAMGWIGYFILHSLLASTAWKKYMQRLMGNNYRYYRFLYSVFAAIGLVTLLFFQFTIAGFPLWQSHGAIVAAGIFPGVAGAVIMWLAIKKYFFSLSGVDVFFAGKKGNFSLQKNGIHSYIRHPLYLGTLLLVWSIFLIFPLIHHLVTCSIITIYTLIGIQVEERKLIIEFGEEYRQYAKKVPMLIPFFF